MTRGSRNILQGYAMSPADLWVPRVLTAGVILACRMPLGNWVSGLPDAMLRAPFSPTAMLSSFPSAGVVTVLNVLAILAAAMMMIGWYTRASSITTALLVLTIHSMTTMTGKVDHDILASLTALVMAGSGWGRCCSIDSLSAKPADLTDIHQAETCWSANLLAIIVALAMFTAAIPKVLNGWLSFESSAVYGHLFINHHIMDKEQLLTRPMLAIQQTWFWEAHDWATILIESVGVLLLWKQRWFTLWLISLMGFHIGVGLTLDIWFWANPVAYAVFFPWSRLDLSRFIGAKTAIYGITAAAVGLAGYCLWANFAYQDAYEMILANQKRHCIIFILVISGFGVVFIFKRAKPA